MAFEEIKAKLGLDITDFERGMLAAAEQAKKIQREIAKEQISQAQQVNREFTSQQSSVTKSARDSASVYEEIFSAQESAAKQILEDEREIASVKAKNIEGQRQAVLRQIGDEETARQRNLQRLDRGLKTLAAAAGLNMQSIAESIARFFTGFSVEAENKLNDLVRSTGDAASKQEAAREDAIRKNKDMAETLAKTEERKRYEKLTDEQKLDELYKRRDELTKRSFSTKQGSTVNLKARLDILDVEEEIEKVKDRQFQKTKDEYEQTLKTEQILEEGVAEVVSMLVDKQAELEDQDKARTAELKKQRAELEAQAKLKAEEIRAARIQDVKPTMEEVTSGKRNIGIGAKQTAKKLEREQQKSIRLADQVQRDFEAISGAATPSERRDAQRRFNASRAALAASQEKIRTGQQALGARIVDANPFMNMEVELGNIKTELENINTKLESTAIK